MGWIEAIDFDAIVPAAFGKRLKRHLAKSNVPGEMVDLYNCIMRLSGQRPDLAGSLAHEAVGVFVRRKERDHEVLFLELCARIWMGNGEIARGLDAMKALISRATSGKHMLDLIELTDDVRETILSNDLPKELVPKALAVATQVYARANELEKLAEAYLEAAMLFAHHGAFQAAYRAAGDAEAAARQMDSPSLLARVLQRLSIIAFHERDFEWSANTGKMAIEAYSALGQRPPPELCSNTATALMNIGALEEACANFEAVLPVLTPKQSLINFQVYVNLAACRRKLKNISGAQHALILAHECAAPDHPVEHLLEFELVQARVMADAAAPADASKALNRAITRFEEMITPINRLHYRRGVRERYVPRFEGILHMLPEAGQADEVLVPLAAIYGGVIADWLALLDWSTAIEHDDSLCTPAARSIPILVRRIAKQGAPFLFGFKEKYDDPWEPTFDPPTWDTLTELAGQLRGIGVPLPFSKATATARADLLAERLADGYCITALTFAGGAALWVLFNARYWRVSFDFAELKSFVSTRTSYEEGTADRTSFMVSLRRLRDRLLPELSAIFDEIAASESPGIIHLQDGLNALPMTMFAIEHDGIRAAMTAGRFEVRVAPALYRQSTPQPLKEPRVSAIRDDKDDLLLARHEAQVASSLLVGADLSIFTPNETDRLLVELRDSHVLLVSTHGTAISRLTDPIFGSLGSPSARHSINVDGIQSMFPWLPYRLAILNACHAGSGLSRNYQHQFRTHDVASYPALLLLNRCSVAGAAAWRTSDTASFLHLALTAIALTEGLTPARALSRATVRLRDLTKTEAQQFLALVPDSVARLKSIQRIATAPESGMFSEPYLHSGFETYSLV